ncbi:CamS family sex pheromone protein [Ornithinibacillus halophilus]|uniref:Protein involved in sex pheromone biosynthesis n=1 Tax=Ornithinibacillus halophilus TaxID=930117 RepID=A0A1M5ETH5_9BACI|nr:CamS family sex pheromone protein [Ornithinibacillus halophilus]SHF82548.1 Protein involved in sex pheromone biosynthesis [Ornithinibacillus halophilus]
MKKVSVILICTLLLITGCIPNLEGEDEVLPNDEEVEGQKSIVPSYRLSDENYPMILPYRVSEARGAIINQMGSNRIDIDEMEEGLRRHSQEYFDPGDYYFEEGQYLSLSTVYNWIDDLNPEVEDEADVEDYRENPRYLTHILEQNFLQRKGEKKVELSGISIGLAMKSVYRFNANGRGPYFEEIDYDTMFEKAQEVAQKVLERLRQREELTDIPIMFAIYREEAQNSAVPGNFVAKTYVKSGDMMIRNWDNLNEENILFPSREAERKYYDDAQMINSFATDIAEFFPNYVGVIGKGFYINEELQELTLEIPIEFYGKGEVLGFTQYAYGLVKEKFSGDYYDLEVNITSSQGQEALIFRPAGENEPTVHVYH